MLNTAIYKNMHGMINSKFMVRLVFRQDDGEKGWQRCY